VNTFVDAVSQTNPDAVQTAIALDKERASGHIRRFVARIPRKRREFTTDILCLFPLAYFTVFRSSLKRTSVRLIRWAQQVSPPHNTQHNIVQALILLQPTAGSATLIGARRSNEASVVKRLHDASAVILGKTTVTEWCNLRSSHTPNGWSPVSGQCYGVFFGLQDPEGSSSGCAVAMSLGLAAATIGTELSDDTQTIRWSGYRCLELTVSQHMGRHHPSGTEQRRCRPKAHRRAGFPCWRYPEHVVQ
jgi:amidase